MKLKELTETMMISNWRKPFDLYGLHNNISAFLWLNRPHWPVTHDVVASSNRHLYWLEVIINVLVGSFCFLWLPMLCVMFNDTRYYDYLDYFLNKLCSVWIRLMMQRIPASHFVSNVIPVTQLMFWWPRTNIYINIVCYYGLKTIFV